MIACTQPEGARTWYTYAPEEGGEELGLFSIYKGRPPTLGVYAVLIHEEHRRQGHGTQMMRECMEECRRIADKEQQFGDTVFLYTVSEAVSRYERVGFAEATCPYGGRAYMTAQV